MATARRRVGPAMVVGLLLGVAGVAGIVAGPSRTAGWTPRMADLAGQAAEPAELGAGHLVISEAMTGGTSASDEFVELYNPTDGELPLEGLELVYISASGATVTRKAAWDAGAAGIASGAHLLIANEAGIFGSVADVTYANGLAATGGSVALRVQGASTAVDALGWGTATSAWLEGSPAPAVAAGHSLERLPGGTEGSGQDTDNNAVDFVDRQIPDPQNAGAPPVGASPSPEASASSSITPTPEATPSQTVAPTPTVTPSLTATPSPTPLPTATPTPTPSPTPTPTLSPSPTPAISVAEARAQPDGTTATIEAISLTDGTFTDGGGCVADATAGIAVLVEAGSFPRGFVVRASGELDDRYHQRTLRASALDVTVLDAAAEPEPIPVATGAVGEAAECRLVSVTAEVVSSATRLSGALAFEVDDGTGVLRLVVPDGSGIEASHWARGTQLSVRGVAGQRDSSGTGTTGYRVVLRDPADVLGILPPATPSATPSASPSGSPLPSDAGLLTIAAAREAPPNTRVRVRGVVTLPSSVLGDGTAAIQDASGAIILRLGDEAGSLALGELLQVDGMRSTKSGMETIRVSSEPLQLGTQPEPGATRNATGSLGEGEEATLVRVRGAVVTTPRRTSAQNVYFDLDDGSGPLRVYLTPGSGIDPAVVTSGAWLEITGVLGQETSGQQPQRGYRLWPRRAADLAIIAAATEDPVSGTGGEPDGGTATPQAHGAGVAGAGAGDEAREARWPAAIPVPRLGATHAAAASGSRLPLPTVDPSPTAAAARPSPALTLLLVVAAAAFASSAAVAAARPGLFGRLHLAMSAAARLAKPAASGPDARPPRPTEEDDRDEAPGPRLVPLPVPDDASVDERSLSTASRSAVQRILPPT